jgi:hypothetical protein
MDNQLTASTGEIFTFKKGINDKQINQLIHYAQTDQTVKNFTSDTKRFASRDSFEGWKKPDTIFYVLTDKEDDLAGIIWIEELPLPEFQPFQPLPSNFKNSNFNTTFAIRTYGNARGKGLSVPFTQKAFTDFLEAKSYPLKANLGMWLATSPDNFPGIASYKKSGFVELGMRKDGQKLIMILP